MKQRFADFFISRNFSLLWLGQALSSFGEFVFESTVIVWLVTDLYRDSAFLPSAVGMAVAASAIPRVLVAPLAGAWVDRLVPLYVENANALNVEFQRMITSYAWDGIWSRPGLDRRTRRIMVLAITAAMGRWGL